MRTYNWKGIALSVAIIPLCIGLSSAQQKLNLASRETPDRILPTEFIIPASPVFDLMGLTPSQVTRFADIKDVKVDWSFRSWRLEPNLAIEGRPFWEILYNRKDLSKYQQASALMRRLSTLDVSIGTAQNEEDQKRLGFAVKLNLYREQDPLMQKNLLKDIGEKYNSRKEILQKELIGLEKTLDTINDILAKPDLRLQMQSIEAEILSLNSQRQLEIEERIKVINAENWNASSLDVAAGKVYTYSTDSIGSITSLRLDRNSGLGLWLNGGIGFGRKFFLTGLVRTFFYKETLQFELSNQDTGEITFDESIAQSILYTGGLNIRYGNPVYTFFIEAVLEKKGFKTPFEALQKSYSPPSDRSIVESSVKWNVVDPFSLSAGGDWRINRSVVLNYAIRMVMDENFTMRTFIPVVNISCLMR